jgi:hypothetical protein
LAYYKQISPSRKHYYTAIATVFAELNPTEHIWDYIREQKEFNNYTFNSLDDVDNKLGDALCDLHNKKSIIRSMCGFDWIISSSCYRFSITLFHPLLQHKLVFVIMF